MRKKLRCALVALSLLLTSCVEKAEGNPATTTQGVQEPVQSASRGQLKASQIALEAKNTELEARIQQLEEAKALDDARIKLLMKETSEQGFALNGLKDVSDDTSGRLGDLYADMSKVKVLVEDTAKKAVKLHVRYTRLRKEVIETRKVAPQPQPEIPATSAAEPATAPAYDRGD